MGQQQTHSLAITHQLGSCGLQNVGLIPRCSLEGFAVYHGWPIAVEALTEGEWEDLPREVGMGTGPIRPSEGCARRVMPESCSLVQPGLHILRSWLSSFGDTQGWVCT